MHLEYDKQEMIELMKDFYLLTGIRMALFDHDYHELLSYPLELCHLCRKMKNAETTKALCDESDHSSFRECQKKNKLIIYHCHAGLIEASAPLIENHVVIGYMMFGQISDEKDQNGLIRLLCKNTSLAKTELSQLPQLTEDIPLKTGEQITAAAKIMEACTFYLLFKNVIRFRRDNFIQNMDQYLTDHLSEGLSVETIIREFGISKTKLYETCDLYYGCGMARHIRTLQMETAKKFLSETNLPITSISSQVGFTDYNYFCRIFKKATGMPARKYRNLCRN
jgi:YesN/AraC family two-component response regulator